MASPLSSRPASELSLADLAALANLAFTGYIGNPVSFTPESLQTWCSNNFVSLSLSHVFFFDDDSSNLNDGPPVAFGLIATRPDKPHESRLAAMGVVPAAQGKGAGSRSLRMIVDAEKKRGMRVLGLEVIKQNPAGVNLYKKSDFSIVRELWGWERGVPAQTEFAADDGLVECTVQEVDSLVKAQGPEDLPWQAWGFSKSPLSKRAFKLRHAYCVVSDPDDKERDTVVLQTLFVDPGSRGKGEGLLLAKAMLGRFEGQRWRLDPIFPREYTEKIATELGFVSMALSQYQMRLDMD